MKRFICVFLTVILLIGTTGAGLISITSFADSPLYGDADADGGVTAADALLALKIVVGKVTVEPTDPLFPYIDVDGNGSITAADALLILKYSVGKITRFPAEPDEPPVSTPDEEPSSAPSDASSMPTESESSSPSETPSQPNSSDPDETPSQPDSSNPDEEPEQPEDRTAAIKEAVAGLTVNTRASAIEDAYAIHTDNGMIYNPLSREADPGDLTLYNVVDKKNGTLELADGSVLTYSVPTQVNAYDMVPITYKLKNGSKSTPLYVEATTFEDQDGSYYDLCLPGTVSVQFDYLGYVYADDDGSHRPYLSPGFNTDRIGTQYPQYNASNLIPSDTAPSGKPLWFKFKVTNNGNTILDGDGNGTFCFEPILKNSSGATVKTVANIYYRLTEDLYPGESTELYIYFGESGGMSLSAGEYRLEIKCLVRNEQSSDDWNTKIWGGYQYGLAAKTITVAAEPSGGIRTAATYQATRTNPTRDTWLHTYEEFTTSYDAWLTPNSVNASETHTLYVQPAAWSDRIVLKFMRGNELNMVSTTVPITVDTDQIKITLNQTAENYIVTDEKTKYPAMASQSMCDMRVNDSLSPYANVAQLNELLNMKECGVNLVTTTEAFNIATSNAPTNAVRNNQDAIYFVSDVLRKLGMRMEGYTGYPYASDTTTAAAYWYTRDRTVRSPSMSGYASEALAKANGLRGLYQFMRWGDNFYVNGRNQVVFNTEDTRGWMRIDYNARAQLGTLTVMQFRAWLEEKYGTIAALNAAWGKSYASFDEIEPEEGTTADHSMRSYIGSGVALSEWSVGLNDLDIYRTLERVNNYAVVLDTLKNYNDTERNVGAASVNASIGIRTEGGNITGVVDYDSPNSHLRHAYYSQRRCAIIPEILAASGTVSMHSDYVTLPYSVKELSELISSSTSLGITEMPLLQANRMRDIAINRKYGDSRFASHYNLLGVNIKGAYINTQVSVFQSFKTIYENGGIPGILWEDYLCDGYVTETQMKEMKFYSQKIAEMMQSDEAQAWATTNVPDVDAVHADSHGAYSYSEAYIEQQIAAAIEARS